MTVGAIGVVQSFATAPQDVSVFDNRSLTAWGLAFIASTLTTNIWATALIAYRTWSVSGILVSFLPDSQPSL